MSSKYSFHDTQFRIRLFFLKIDNLIEKMNIGFKIVRAWHATPLQLFLNKSVAHNLSVRNQILAIYKPGGRFETSTEVT